MKNVIFFIIAVSLAAFSSCQREEVSLNPQTINTLNDQILSADLFDDVLDEVEYTTDLLFGELKSGFDDCRTVTLEPMDRLSWPKTITIDFGVEGCTVREGVIKKGKIIINMDAPYNGRAWTKVVTFDNYSVNDARIEGTHTTTFTRGDGKPTWTSTVTNGSITTADGVIRTRESVHIRTQTRGIDTIRDRADDAFQISGEAAGTRQDGKTFSWVITEPLVISNNCRWVRKGIKIINLEGKSEITLDYGDNDCDNFASVTQDGITKEIKLTGRRR